MAVSFDIVAGRHKLNKCMAGLAKSLARRPGPGAIVFSSRATKMYHRPARRALLNTGLPRNVPSKLRARGRAEEIMCHSHTKISWESH